MSHSNARYSLAVLAVITLTQTLPLFGIAQQVGDITAVSVPNGDSPNFSLKPYRTSASTVASSVIWFPNPVINSGWTVNFSVKNLVNSANDFLLQVNNDASLDGYNWWPGSASALFDSESFSLGANQSSVRAWACDSANANTVKTYEFELLQDRTFPLSNISQRTVNVECHWDNDPPSVPTITQVLGLSATGLRISWSVASDGTGSGVHGYALYRNGNLITTTTGTSFDDTGLTTGTVYSYTVKSVDRVGNTSGFSAALSGSPQQPCYTISTQVSPSNAGSVTKSPGPNCGAGYSSQTMLTLTATPSPGFSFDHWESSTGATSTSNPVQEPVQESATVTAVFTQRFSLTTVSSPSGSGTISVNPPPGSDGKYSSGLQVTLTATPNSGFKFVSWAGDAVGANPTTITMDANKSVTANFASTNTYTITLSASPANGGTVTGGGNFPAGATVTVAATANPNYQFMYWSEGGSQLLASASFQFAVARSRNLVANFSPSTSTATLIVQASPQEGGTVSGGGTFQVNSDHQISASANQGWTFNRWSDGVTSNPRTVTLQAGGATYTALFVSNQSGIVINPSNGHYYEYVSTLRSWVDAKADAEARSYLGMKGHLATIQDQLENNFVMNLITDNTAWLGGFQPTGSPEPAGNWQWITGEPFAFQGWRSDEPNDSGGENAIQMHGKNHPDAGTWNDANGNFGSSAVVEYEPSLKFSSIRRAGNQIIFEWSGTAVLQQTDSNGSFQSWSDVSGATSPQTVTPTGNRKFYRLRK